MSHTHTTLHFYVISNQYNPEIHSQSFSFPTTGEQLEVLLSHLPIAVALRHTDTHVGRRVIYQPRGQDGKLATLAQIGSDLVLLLSLLEDTHYT